MGIVMDLQHMLVKSIPSARFSTAFPSHPSSPLPSMPLLTNYWAGPHLSHFWKVVLETITLANVTQTHMAETAMD